MMNNVIAIIQARMGSQRFPGKTMHRLGDKPCIGHHLDAVARVFSPERIFIATSLDPANDIIESFGKDQGVSVYRGSENNVAGRFLDIVRTAMPDVFVRFNADSPLLDYRIISSALEKMEATGADIVTTMQQHPYPSGMNVEVINRIIFTAAYPEFTEAAHFEHVTRYFYEMSGRFKIASLSCPVENARSYKFTFDTPEDAKRLEVFFNTLEQPHYMYDLEEKCLIYEKIFGSGEKC